MKKFILLFSIVCLSTNCFSQVFHAFLFCKTNDPNIHQSVTINYGNVQNELQKIASALQLTYVEHSATGRNFTAPTVKKIIENTDVGENDIVFMYFSTHGAMTRYDSNIFPQLDIPTEMVSAYTQHLSMRKKNPKLVITAIEACSGYLNITPQEAFVYQGIDNKIPVPGLSDLEIRNIKKLFSSNCDLVITAGNPGKNTWATSSGSMFTNCLLRSMHEQFDTENELMVSWDRLLNQAKIYTSAMTANTPIQYYPVWEKNNCTGGPFASAGTQETSPVKERNLKFIVTPKRNLRPVNSHTEELTIKNESGIGIE
jgi:hypothetical protein